MKKFITLKPVRIVSEGTMAYQYVILPDIAIRKKNIVSIARVNYPSIALITEIGDAKPVDCVFLNVVYKINEEKIEEVLVDEQFDEVLEQLEA